MMQPAGDGSVPVPCLCAEDGGTLESLGGCLGEAGGMHSASGTLSAFGTGTRS